LKDKTDERIFQAVNERFRCTGNRTQKLPVSRDSIRCERETIRTRKTAVAPAAMLGFMQAEQTRPANEASLQGHGKMETFNQKIVFKVKAMRPGPLSPRIEVEFIAALAARQIDEPSQHLAAKTATARRLSRDQVIDVEDLTPRERVEDAEASAADALAVILEIYQAIARPLLSLHARQE
jgi:hypothetical protein